MDKRPNKRSQDTLPDMGEYPHAHYDTRESGTIHTYSTQANNPSEAWLQGATGAFRVVNPDGSKSEYYPGESRIEYDGLTITVAENIDAHVGGHYTLKTKGGLHLQVSGDGQVVIGGAAQIIVLGDAGISVNGHATMHVARTFNVDAAAVNIRGKNGMTIGTDGDLSIQAGGSIKIQEIGDPGPGYSTTDHPASTS